MNRTYATRQPVASPDVKPTKAAKKEGHRETVEAIVVAFILALLVRGFEAEAFVIPTGSMAPTLMGRHKEVTCPQCQFVYSVNASGEDEANSPLGLSNLRLRPDARQGARVVSGTCVNCRFRAPVADDPSFNGDRILVMKFPYDMPFLPGASKPERWDVVVFRYPETPEVSYIKRLVGLPGETVRIHHGDIYIKSPDGKDFQIARKPLMHQRAMAMMVYDDRHRAAALWGKPEWTRWASTQPGAWKEGTAGPGSYTLAATTEGSAELRYRNLVPDPAQWEAILAEEALPHPPRSTLITDFYSYNTNQTSSSRGDDSNVLPQSDWVGDLHLSGSLEIKELKGVVRFELVEGGVANQAEINLAEGTVNLYHGETKLNEAPAALKLGVGKHDVYFANVDDRLTLVVDGQAPFGDGLPYDEQAGRPVLPSQADLAPAAVIGQGGASIVMRDLVLKRDIYYTLNPGHADYDSLWAEDHIPRSGVELFDNLSQPERFGFLAQLPSKDYQIRPERFLMLGDNSPWSRDSRGWNNDDRRNFEYKDVDEEGAGWDTSDRASWEVPRSLLTGKAFFVYWPHGKPFGPDIRINPDFRIPFRPYLERMKWIR